MKRWTRLSLDIIVIIHIRGLLYSVLQHAGKDGVQFAGSDDLKKLGYDLLIKVTNFTVPV